MSHILAAIDFSAQTQSVLNTAEQLAKALNFRLTVLHVAAPDPDFVGYSVGPQTVRDTRAQALHAERNTIHTIVEDLAGRGIDAHGLLASGVTIEKIIEEAQRFGCSLIVLGSHGHGAIFDMLMGSTSSGVLRHATCPVVVVPGKRS